MFWRSLALFECFWEINQEYMIFCLGFIILTPGVEKAGD
jgi:hypothetical protein